MTSPSPDDVRCTTWFSGDFDQALRYDAERAWRWVIAGLRSDEDAQKEIQRQIVDCTGCSLAVADYLVGVYGGALHAQWGAEMAVKVAQHLLVEVLSSPDIIDTDTAP